MNLRRAISPLFVGLLLVALAGVAIPAEAQQQVASDSTNVEGAEDTVADPSTTLASGAGTTLPLEQPVEEPILEQSVPEQESPENSVEGFAVDDDGLIDVIVRFEPAADVDVDAPDSPVAGMDVEHVYEEVLDGAALSVTPEQLAELRADPAIASIAEDKEVYLQGPTSLWNLDRIDQRPLLKLDTYYPSGTGSGVRVYVVDSGVSPHPQFGARLLSGVNVTTETDGTTDCTGHGTHVAGTVAGSTYGVATQANIIPIRVFGCSRSTAISTVIKGLDQILLMDPRDGKSVVNMSLGIFGVEDELNEAVGDVIQAGIPVVVAAGNSNLNACNTSPASAAGAIVVGAINQSDQRASFSNFGSCVDIFAPGVNILSSIPGGSGVMEGTSMASPHVAGAIAVLASGSTTSQQAADTVLSSATQGAISDVQGSPNKLVYVGYPETLTMVTTSLPVATLNQSYFASLQATGTHSQFIWQLESGGLPVGLHLSSTGYISGLMFSRLGSTFTLRVIGGGGATVSRSFTISPAQAPPQSFTPIVGGSSRSSSSFNFSFGSSPFVFTSRQSSGRNSGVNWGFGSSPGGGQQPPSIWAPRRWR